jgi:hypothetical protein
VAGFWTRPDEGNRGLAMLVFESEETARAAADVVRQAPPPPTVSIESAEVREVVAHA